MLQQVKTLGVGCSDVDSYLTKGERYMELQSNLDELEIDKELQWQEYAGEKEALQLEQEDME